MELQISDKFNFKKLIRYILPSISMMLFTSIYGVVDGFFISNFVGKDAFSAINLIFPALMIMGTFGFMFGTGGNALISKTLGENDKERANRYFSLLTYVTIILGVIIAIIGEIFLPQIVKILKADETLFDYCLVYGRIYLIGTPFFMVQNLFQSFCNTAGKPKLGFYTTIGAGVSNIIGDALLVAVFRLETPGAAMATVFSQFIGAIIPIIYFSRENKSSLKLGKMCFEIRALLKTCFNGFSEVVTNISLSVVSIVFNFQLLKYAGNDGVAAYGVLMYVSFIFVAVFIGTSIGVSPIIGYNFGAKNKTELKSVISKTLLIFLVLDTLMCALGFLTAVPVCKLYVGYDAALYEMTLRVFYIFTPAYLFIGFSIFISSMFTALSNGLVSAIVSFVRTFVIQVACVLIFPIFFELDGIWMSMTISEIISICVCFGAYFINKKKYEY